MDEDIDDLLPFINLCAWINMVMEMRQFDLTRRFVCIFMISINSIRGFIIFLLLMVFTFASTTNIL